MRVLLIAFLMAFTAIAGTTNVRIYHQAVASPASVQNKQIGVNTTADADLGFKMWFGKDADGNVNQFLCKNQKIKATSIRQDSSFSLFDTSKHYRSPLANFDSSKSVASRITRAYLDSIRSCDTAYYTALRALRLYYTNLTGTKITADTGNFKYLTADSCLKLPLRVSDCTTDGSLWYQENHGSIHSYVDGIVASVNRTIFVQSNTVLCSNTVSQTSLIGTSPNHTFDSFPANYFSLGKSHKFYMSGIYSTKAPVAGTMIVRIKLNATVLCSAIVDLDPSETDQAWKIEGFNICIDTGTTGKFRVNTGFDHWIAGIAHRDNILTPNGGVTVSTKIKQKPDITVQFGTANVGNKIKSTQFVIEELH